MTGSEATILNGMEVKPFEQMLAEVREVYLTLISDALDEALAKFVLPSDRIAVLHDAAVFCAFMAAVKCAEVSTPAGTSIESRDGLKQWWPIIKKLKDGVAPMLLEWGVEARQQQVKGTGEANDGEG